MTSKHIRIIKKLLEAKGEGVPELELFDDFESRGNSRQIKHRVVKLLGSKEAIKVADGRWYLNKEYWDLTPKDVGDILIGHELAMTRRIVFWSMLVSLVSVLLLGLYVGLNYEFIWLD